MVLAVVALRPKTAVIPPPAYTYMYSGAWLVGLGVEILFFGFFYFFYFFGLVVG